MLFEWLLNKFHTRRIEFDVEIFSSSVTLNLYGALSLQSTFICCSINPHNKPIEENIIVASSQQRKWGLGRLSYIFSMSQRWCYRPSVLKPGLCLILQNAPSGGSFSCHSGVSDTLGEITMFAKAQIITEQMKNDNTSPLGGRYMQVGVLYLCYCSFTHT